MAILQAYFDESGKLHDDGDYVVFGGLAGRMDEVSVFSRKWRELLGSDVDHVHMRDAMRMEGAFRAWKGKEARRDELLIECAKLAHSQSARLIVSEMDKADFRKLAPSEQRRLKNPAYGGFEACIRALASSFSGDDLHIWYDESQEYAGVCLKLYQKIKNLNTDLARRLPSVTFANDEKYPGLQAADMVAYSAYVIKRDGSASQKVVQEINSILNKRRDHGMRHLLYVKGSSLGSGILE